jgi:hypothetical protein
MKVLQYVVIGLILGMLILYGIVVKVVNEYTPTIPPRSQQEIDHETAAIACEGFARGRHTIGLPDNFEPPERAEVKGAGTRESPWEVSVYATPPSGLGRLRYHCRMVKGSDGKIELLQLGERPR